MTSPIHAEVRAAVIEALENYHDHGEFHEYTPLEKQRHADGLLQAVADALLANLPKKTTPKRKTNVVEVASSAMYNSALDAVTRVIGELRGSDPIGEKK